MTGLDVPWAQEQLQEFLRLTDQVGYEQTPGVVIFGTHYRGGESEIAGLAQVVEHGGKTFKNQQRGAAALGEGLYAGLRNPASHEVTGELPEHEALVLQG